MGIASLVLGIVAILISWIPIVGLLSFVLVIVGLVLGIVDISKKSKTQSQKGIGIAGVIVCAIAIPIIIITTIISMGIITAAIMGDDDLIKHTQETLNQLEYNEQISNNRLYQDYYDYYSDWNDENWL